MCHCPKDLPGGRDEGDSDTDGPGLVQAQARVCASEFLIKKGSKNKKIMIIKE